MKVVKRGEEEKTVQLSSFYFPRLDVQVCHSLLELDLTLSTSASPIKTSPTLTAMKLNHSTITATSPPLDIDTLGVTLHSVQRKVEGKVVGLGALQAGMEVKGTAINPI